MKHTKKLIPALGMLLLSACMLVTSTFAWFSMNEKVDATGMTVIAKGEQVYLQIKETAFSTADNGKKMDGIDLSETSDDDIAKLFPAAVMKDTSNAYQNGTSFIWVSAKGTDAEDGTKEGNYADVTGSEADYRLEKSMFVRLDPTAGATAATAPLSVLSVSFADGQTINEMAQCISVMVVGDNCAQLFKYEDGAFVAKAGDGKLTQNAFAEMGTGLQVKVYIFFDGDNELCTLENLAKAKAGVNKYAINISFSCK